MNARTYRYAFIVLFAALLVLLSACQPGAITASPLPTQPPSATAVIPATQTPETPTQVSGGTAGEISGDYSAVAENMTIESVAAQPAGADKSFWEAGPAYRRLTLQGYPVANHLLQPQIFVYPVGEMAAANENMGKIAADLQALLQSQQSGDALPFLPLFNASQVMHSQAAYLDFKNGQGVRFLTQFDQAPLPINNFELIYTFQGLTSDGKYYIAAVLPVTNPELPAGNQVSEEQANALNDFPAYLSKTVSLLDQQPAEKFTPDLNKLDALMRSIEVK